MEKMEFIEANGIKITMPCDKLLDAMAKMQAVLDTAKKESDNPFFKSKYADLAQCLATAKKPMADNGLSISQHCSFDGIFVQCVTVLGHNSGQMMVSTLSVPVKNKDAQGVGSSITYARRYALSSILGIAQKDDDANDSVGMTKEDEKKVEEKKASEKNAPEEHWRMLNGNKIEIRTRGGWMPLEKMGLQWLEVVLNDPRFQDIKDFVQKQIKAKKGVK